MDEIGMGKDEIRMKLGWERTSLDGKGWVWPRTAKQRPWCNGPLTEVDIVYWYHETKCDKHFMFEWFYNAYSMLTFSNLYFKMNSNQHVSSVRCISKYRIISKFLMIDHISRCENICKLPLRNITSNPMQTCHTVILRLERMVTFVNFFCVILRLTLWRLFIR